MNPNTITQEAPQPIEEKKVVLAFDEKGAARFIENVREQVPVFQDIIDEYHSFRLERKLNTIEVVTEFMSAPAQFIHQERKKRVPAKVNGTPVNVESYLNTVTPPSPELSAFLDQVNARPTFDPTFFVIDADGQLDFNEEAIPLIEDRFKRFAVGRQVLALDSLKQLADAATQLRRMGYYIDVSILQWKNLMPDGSPGRFIYSEDLCLSIRSSL